MISKADILGTVENWQRAGMTLLHWRRRGAPMLLCRGLRIRTRLREGKTIRELYLALVIMQMSYRATTMTRSTVRCPSMVRLVGVRRDQQYQQCRTWSCEKVRF
jgi:hypothetical protein